MKKFPLGARGERPCFFPCRLPWEVLRELTSIPGVSRAPGGVATTYDIAPTVARMLGQVAPTLAVEDNLPPDELRAELSSLPGLARYHALGLGAKLRGYQKEGAVFLARRAYAMNADPMRCLSGETKLYVMRCGNVRKLTLEELHQKMTRTAPGVRWREGVDVFARSMFSDGVIAWNRIEAIHAVGEKLALRVRTTDGYVIDASEDHRFLTPTGELEARALRPGMTVYTSVERKRATSTILSVGAVGHRVMFDLTMLAPTHNYVAGHFVVHNSGKSIQAITASVLVDATKTLIVCPALAKYVWADEVAKWTQEETLILEGRAGTEARQYCLACEARGARVDETGKRAACPACKKRNGQSSGYRLFTGADRVHEAIAAAKYVVVNYDLLVGQKESDAAGALHVRGDLPGWAPALGRHRFDVVIADEAHVLRGWSTDQTKRGQTRRERFVEVADPIDRVWGLTGTPIFGFTRDLWGPLDALSKGAMTGNGVNDRLPFTFHSRYCGGAKDSYGWRADGRSVYADTELVERLHVVKIQRPRSLILSEMPAKVRQVIRIDPVEKARARRGAGADDAGGAESSSSSSSTKSSTSTSTKPVRGSSESAFVTMMKRTLEMKLPTIVENVVTELSEGSRVVVFTLLRKHAELVTKALEAGITKADVKTKMREVDAKVWCAHGDTTPEIRFQMARTFREHTGAGVFVATIDAVQVAVSLKGATSVHFADLHWQPAAMLQAEDRPYEVGTTGLTILYYVVRGSIDEHIESTVLPKVTTLAHLVAEEGADAMTRAFADPAEAKKTLKDIIAELVSKTDVDLGAFDDDNT